MTIVKFRELDETIVLLGPQAEDYNRIANHRAIH